MAKKKESDVRQLAPAVVAKTIGQQLKPAGKKPVNRTSHAQRSKAKPR